MAQHRVPGGELHPGTAPAAGPAPPRVGSANHPNIAQIIEFGEAEGSYFIVMEYVPGQSLSALNKRLKKRFQQRMGVLEGTYMVMEMLQGLHAAHAQKDRQGRPANIIHRDVSPQNCLISYDGNTKLIDFGIAKAKDRIERTQIGTIKGKLRYLAPEMIDPGRFGDGGQFDHRVDVFAAGIVLFELVGGRQLFTGDNEFDVYQNITDSPAPDLGKEGLIDPALMRIIERSLAKKAVDRFATAEDFADELRAFLYRTDPSFKAQRISSLMDQCFPEEKQALANLEAEEASELSEVPQEITFAKKSEAGGTGSRTRASRKRPRKPGGSGAIRPAMGSGRSKAAPGELAPVEPGVATRMSDLGDELGVNPSAATQMVAPEHLDELQQGGNHELAHFEFDDQTVGLHDDQTQTGGPDADETRLAVGAFDENETPATSTQRIPRKPSSGTKWAWVIAAASILGLMMAVGGVVLTESVLDRPKTAQDGAAGEPDDAAPSEPESVPSDKGRLTINASPENARVAVGSSTPEEVPATVEGEPGTTINLLFTAPGFKSLSKKAEFPANGADRMLSFELEPERVELVVRVKNAPPKTEVRFDGDLYFDDIKILPGEKHLVTVTAPGYERYKKIFTASPAEDFVLTVELERDREIVKKERQVEDEKKRQRKKREAAAFKKREKEKKVKLEKEKEKRRKPAYIRVAIFGWANVKIDGKSVGQAPARFKVSPGRHKVEVSNPKGSKTFNINVGPGKEEKLKVSF